MEIKKGQIYFYQSKYSCNWVKITNISDTYISTISNVNLDKIKDVIVDDLSDYMNKIYYHRNRSTIFCYHSKLNKQLSEDTKDSLFCCWFNTYQEEIDGDFNGNIGLWMRYHKLEHRWDEKMGLNGFKLYTYSNHKKDFMLYHHELLIPFHNLEQFTNDIGSVNMDVFPYINGLRGDRLTAVQRDISINMILS